VTHSPSQGTTALVIAPAFLCYGSDLRLYYVSPAIETWSPESRDSGDVFSWGISKINQATRYFCPQEKVGDPGHLLWSLPCCISHLSPHGCLEKMTWNDLEKWGPNSKDANFGRLSNKNINISKQWIKVTFHLVPLQEPKRKQSFAKLHF